MCCRNSKAKVFHNIGSNETFICVDLKNNEKQASFHIWVIYGRGKEKKQSCDDKINYLLYASINKKSQRICLY